MKAMNEKGAAAATHRPPILSFKFFSLSRISILVLVILFGFASASYAAEDEKNKQIEELTSIQLGDYSLRYEGDAPRKTIAADAPPGMTNFRKETNGPFFGLKFSTPLKDDFFKPGR